VFREYATTTSKIRKCSKEVVNVVVGYRERKTKASPEVDSII
jgi:hypothetical protein